MRKMMFMVMFICSVIGNVHLPKRGATSISCSSFFI
jgi:hypothetical protein